MKTQVAVTLMVVVVSAAVGGVLLPDRAGAAPLHQRIDAIVDAARIGPKAEVCSDAEFVRRLYLNVVGVIPTADEARQFIDDESPDKRAQLIDRLLDDERFSQHMRIIFDALLMERRPEKHVKNGPWRAYLLKSFREHKPLNELAREILWAGPDSDGPQAAARFYLDREVQPQLITRDVGRVMLGRDLQCAQCHDHPVIADYEQAEYYGIYAFINRSYLFTDKKKKQTVLAEKAEGEVSYESVFDKGTKYHTGPHLPDRPEINEPTLGKDELYKVTPPKGGRGVPAYSRRQQLAERMTAGDYQPFNRNMANRLWAVMFGRGIVHPLDLHHTDNPPAHPELLNLLADELVGMKFDMRSMLREIALSETYQRSCRLPEDLATPKSELEQQLASEEVIKEQQLTAAETARAEARSAAVEIARIEKTLADATDEIEKAQSTLAAADTKLGEAATNLEKSRQVQEANSAAAREAGGRLAGAQKAAEENPDDEKLAGEAKNLEKAANEAQTALAKAEAALKQQQNAHTQAQTEQAAAQKALDAATAAQAAAQQEAKNIDKFTQQLQQARAKAQVAQDKANTAQAAIEDGQTLLAVATAEGENAVAEAREKLLRRWSARFFVHGLVPLSPEQMAMSLHQAVGDLPARLDAARKSERDKAAKEAEKAKQQAAKAERDGKRKEEPQDGIPSEPDPVDEHQLERRAQQAVYSALQGVMDELVGAFGQTDGQPTRDYEGRASEALYLVNSPRVKGLIGGRLAQRLAVIEEPGSLAEELYLAVLSRRPTDIETEAVAQFLKDRDDNRKLATEEMIWGLISSAEFRFNH